MSSHTMPSSWTLARISDIAVKGSQRKPGHDEHFTYVDIGSIDRNLKKIVDPQKITGDQAPSRARKTIETDDVLVSLTRPNLNAVALVDKEHHNQIASTGFEVIKPIIVNSRYIFGLVRSKEFINEISGAVQGALYPAAKSSDVRNFEFPLPPLNEQKVIADKLDTLLAQVENTKARLERIPQILKRFRQSVLAAAVSGRLTKEWRDSHVENDKWQQVCLGDVTENGPQNGIYKPIKLYGSGCLIIRIDSFYDGVIADWNELKRVQLEPLEIEKWQVNQGDLLINRVNSIEYLGKSALVYELTEPAVFESNIMRLAFKRCLAEPKFISLFLRSPVGLERLRANAKLAVNQASINQTDVKSCLLALPTLNEQTEIVRRVDQLFAHADRIEQQVNNALARVNNLTQSILAKAFRGELTEQWREDNPELISGENSATALLERIKAERVAMEPAKNAARRKTTA